jgi:hypothetical protein
MEKCLYIACEKYNAEMKVDHYQHLKYGPWINSFEGISFENKLWIVHVHTGDSSQVPGKAG